MSQPKVKACGDKGFSPVMVAQKWQFDRIGKEYSLTTVEGWETSQIRKQLGLVKQKISKSDAVIATHAVDGIALACSKFIKYQITSLNSRAWVGQVDITPCPLTRNAPRGVSPWSLSQLFVVRQFLGGSYI